MNHTCPHQPTKVPPENGSCMPSLWQEKIYRQKVTHCKDATFQGLADAEVLALVAALPDFKALASLTIRGCRCDADAAAALWEARRGQLHVP